MADPFGYSIPTNEERAAARAEGNSLAQRVAANEALIHEAEKRIAESEEQQKALDPVFKPDAPNPDIPYIPWSISPI